MSISFFKLIFLSLEKKKGISFDIPLEIAETWSKHLLRKRQIYLPPRFLRGALI